MDPSNYHYDIKNSDPKQIRDIRGLETPVTIRVFSSINGTHDINDNVDFWVENAMKHTNPYIVRLYGRTNLSGQHQAVFTEVCLKTLKQWMQDIKSRDISDPDKHTTAYLPHPDIGAMFQCTFRGLISIRVQHQGCQAHVSEDDIFVNDNNPMFPKFSKLVVRSNGQGEGDDILAFCKMMKRLLKNLPLEMFSLIDYLKSNKLKEEALMTAINYPLWLSLTDRLDYRDDASAVVRTLEKNDQLKWKKLAADLSNILMAKAKHTVRWTHTITLNKHTNRCKDMHSVYEFPLNNPNSLLPYNDDPLSFLRFGRNYKHHKESGCSKEVAEKRLTWLHPFFMPSLHEALVRHGIYVRP